MIHKLILKNFKRIKNETFEFNNFDLIVGSNNSGKSTVLQALAIWQFCVDQFTQSKRSGSRGISVVLPNFTALPLPEFNLLWNERTDREYIEDLSKPSKKAQNYIYIEIDIYWYDENLIEQNFAVQLRYQSPQALFAIPKEGWRNFADKTSMSSFPRIVYVPPFSGLEPHERWMDDGNVKQNIGKAQPGSVLRNLLYRVIDKNDLPVNMNGNWQEIVQKVNDWFGVELMPAHYEKGISTQITNEYKANKKSFDIISGGSGFHQILTLLAFVYGYPEVSTILFDEPDAHLHVNLQRQIVNYFKIKSDKQFLIATHSEEFVRGVEINSILSILSGSPRRVNSNNEVLHALSEIDNIDVVRTEESPYILYLEGEDDERLLSIWAKKLKKEKIYQLYYPYILGGSTKREMKDKADRHFKALRQIVPNVQRVILLDYDSDETAINPDPNNPVVNEWKRKNIDNYLLIPDIWKKAVANTLQIDASNDLFFTEYSNEIENFFNNENLILPPNSSWVEVNANIFKVLDGKKLLFENPDSLFERIRKINNDNLKINRTTLANAMDEEYIHSDIVNFFLNLEKQTKG
ncbi:ATP-dependent nuclease [Kaistella sp.]|uniref:ATP-dependent nuclease n=1 Tax=Kaistella sp. TaxID=2782235 RepID=UPI002F94E676